ncbi:hypothetical protein SETIT_3G247200v2 [Setaria italica]|uniref:Uncharacterized protein n=2 Tax=Setaria italica TaxID=4555 RepID=A0A368QIS3_SETIT|nr:hypothetical protein SETIT_3G247200v2 [Setaria italica]
MPHPRRSSGRPPPPTSPSPPPPPTSSSTTAPARSRGCSSSPPGPPSTPSRPASASRLLEHASPVETLTSCLWGVAAFLALPPMPPEASIPSLSAQGRPSSAPSGLSPPHRTASPPPKSERALRFVMAHGTGRTPCRW